MKLVITEVDLVGGEISIIDQYDGDFLTLSRAMDYALDNRKQNNASLLITDIDHKICICNYMIDVEEWRFSAVAKKFLN